MCRRGEGSWGTGCSGVGEERGFDDIHEHVVEVVLEAEALPTFVQVPVKLGDEHAVLLEFADLQNGEGTDQTRFEL